jgi:outer membrane protein assembly factor BamB
MTRRGWARWVSLTAMAWLGASVFAGDWPQLQHGPQRSGYTEERLVPPFTVAWTRNFQPERVAGFVQPVVAGGKVFVGTEAGNFYALDALTGRELWKDTQRTKPRPGVVPIDLPRE